MRKKVFRKRYLSKVQLYQKTFPVVAILGPRQSGKSTLAKQIAKDLVDSEYFDLENFETAAYISSNYLSFFRTQKDKIVFLDEIQKLPEIFSTMRGVIDADRQNGSFFILGSASSDLLHQTSESLTGRIGYIELTPFDFSELNVETINDHWLRGGFPESYLAESFDQSFLWREAYIRNIIEKDIRDFKSWDVDSLDSATLYKLFQFLSHFHGRSINYSKISASLGKKDSIIKRYVTLLEKMYLIRSIAPYANSKNLKKKLVKSSKIYIRDSGVLHAIARIKNMHDLVLHPLYGFYFEGYVIENLLTIFDDAIPSFYLSDKQEEIDLILELGDKKVAIEMKTSTAPSLTKKGIAAIRDINPDQTFIVVPSYGSANTFSYEYGDVTIGDLSQVIEGIRGVFGD